MGFDEFVPVFGTNPCISPGGIAGFISTNAGIYSSAPPLWNEKTRSLTYTVSSAHFLSNGEVVSGSYDLVIKDAVAECLWGKNVEKGQATISVTSDKGVVEVSTSSFTSLGGWTKFSISGFHYSNPTFTIGFRNIPKVTIFCRRNKSTVKVVDPNPKCPIGYSTFIKK